MKSASAGEVIKLISCKKITQALRAIQQLAIAARWYTGKNELDRAYYILDGLEYLPTLILAKQDNTEVFHEYLRDMAKHSPIVNHALEAFEADLGEGHLENPFLNI